MHRIPITIVCLLITIHTLRAENWPEFRGPTGQGHYPGKNLPTEWSTTKNVAWKQKIPGHGWSSPIVYEGRIYLTSAELVEGSKELSLVALCFDTEKGKLLWKTEVLKHDEKPKPHPKNSHASPTPITDGKRVYVHFGHQGTAALDFDGKIAWRTTDHKYPPVHGNGGSPILVDDKLVFSADGGGKSQFVIALDTANGKTAWKTPRKSTAFKKFSFSTPLLITVNKQKQIVSPGSDAVVAYDPANGKELWRAGYDGYSVIPRPVFGHGMIFFSSGYDAPSVLAVKVDGKGDVTKTHTAWTLAKGAPHTPSLLLVGDELYMVSDRGIASCVDAKSGKVHWSERLEGNYSASPFHADGKIYYQSEEGVTTVVRAAKTFEQLATSNLKERTFASYAVADGAIYLRTETQLYRLQAK